MKTRPALWVLILAAAFASQTAAEEPTGRGDRQEVVNSIGMKLERIPAGQFMMGAVEPVENLLRAFPAYKVEAKTDYLFQDEYPRHRVRITKPFYFGRCEVTVGQFRQFTKATGYKTEPERDGTGGWGYNPKTGQCEGRRLQYNWLHPGFAQTDDQPVIDVTWNDAVAFCRWLGRKEGKNYRLPTEAEWEYACRAGAATRYAYGDDPAAMPKAANIMNDRGRTQFPHVQEIVLPKDNRFTVAVGKYPPNRLGLCDMHGNVWEWCADWYGKDYYAKSPVDDPAGPSSGKVHVRRGGAWNSFPLYARTSFRNWNTPATRCVNVGFRVVQDDALATPAKAEKP
jgi:formylglycine-generating enzyme